MIVLPITLTIAAAAALLNIWIAARVGTLRRRHNIVIGDGSNPALTARMRAHGNFSEYAPLFVILLGLVELAEGSPVWLWGVAALFILGRILHVFGMDRQTINALRGAGIGLTLLCTAGIALYAIAIPYLHRARTSAIHYAAGPLPSTPSPTNGLLRRS
jgi:uncharacterized membrane protein YecN with MAPEG domain